MISIINRKIAVRLPRFSDLYMERARQLFSDGQPHSASEVRVKCKLATERLAFDLLDQLEMFCEIESLPYPYRNQYRKVQSGGKQAATRPPKETVYDVGVPKAYFPPELRPKGIQEGFVVVKVKATSRREAVQKAWQEHATEWLSQMSPKVTRVRKISLYADEPSLGAGGLLGRLPPIQVYQD
jgi:hypothetical protein